MKLTLKPIQQQVMVITGATSGIGLVTARMAASRGARLVLAARNEEALHQFTSDINESGGSAVPVTADVGVYHEVRHIADMASHHFGGFDTWVNNAGVSIYGRLDTVPLADHRRLFDTNYWGVVHGSLVAAAHLRNRGGALINIGSVLGDRSIPLQGAYCASKHAVKGFTDALRMELEEAGAPISVTLIKPSTIDTPYRQHAKNFLRVEPLNPPPVYAPEIVARTILHCAQHPMRDVTVGGSGRLLSAVEHIAPSVLDKLMERVLFDMQQTDTPASAALSDNLHQASSNLNERGGYPGQVMEHSVYTSAVLHPIAAAALALGLGVLAATTLLPLRYASSNGRRRRDEQQRLRQADRYSRRRIVPPVADEPI